MHFYALHETDVHTKPIYYKFNKLFCPHGINRNPSLCTPEKWTVTNYPANKPHCTTLNRISWQIIKRQINHKEATLYKQESMTSNRTRFCHLQKHPSSFLGAVPVARYLAAISSALRRSSPRLASMIALFSSASLWMIATLFFMVSTYAAFCFSSFSCSHDLQTISALIKTTPFPVCWDKIVPAFEIFVRLEFWGLFAVLIFPASYHCLVDILKLVLQECFVKKYNPIFGKTSYSAKPFCLKMSKIRKIRVLSFPKTVSHHIVVCKTESTQKTQTGQEKEKNFLPPSFSTQRLH